MLIAHCANCSESKKSILTEGGLVYEKQNIYRAIIKNYRKYDYEHLMNPYLYFTEAPLKP